MFLPGILCAPFPAGGWLYCQTNAALTPATRFSRVSKRTWVAFIAVTFPVAAAATEPRRVWLSQRTSSTGARAGRQLTPA
jgi:hypothetical protein